MRFHLPALPGRSLDPDENPACAYSQKVRRFRLMMAERGHECFTYEVDGPELPFEPGLWEAANQDQAQRIAANMEDRDFLCVIGGACQESISAALPQLMTVEYGVGYGGVYSKYRVFESYAWMHQVYGHLYGTHAADGRFFDAVIPNYFDPDDFPAGSGGDYLLYVGRLIERKGVLLAADVAREVGLPLVLAGEGATIPDYGERIGLVGPELRASLMGGALALIAPTLYVEPFGGVVAEAQMCGTPTITTDWGAFTETVTNGVSGYRCRTFAEFVGAVGQVGDLDRSTIREGALRRWSMDVIAEQYEEYFERLGTLWGEGFYEREPKALEVGI